MLALASASLSFTAPGLAPVMAPRAAVQMRGPNDQVTKFQEGTDFLFFQSPAPLTSGEFFEAADPPPDFFSGENFADLEITGPQIAVTATGIASFVAVVGVLLEN